jgi:hypothetical protein
MKFRTFFEIFAFLLQKHKRKNLKKTQRLYFSMAFISAGFVRQKKEVEGSIFYQAKDGVFFHIFCLTNPAQEAEPLIKMKK